MDELDRRLLESDLQRFIDQDGLTGVTTNPTIFQKAILGGARYDEALARALQDVNDPREVFFQIAYEDVRDAADILRPVFDRTRGRDGYVSFELPPDLAHSPESSIDTALQFREQIGRDNVLIKVPGTPEGVHAFEELTARGQSINVTLLFAVERYEEIANAYLRGLERRADSGAALDRIASVASFFVSRVDTKVDTALDECEAPSLKGRAAIANAKVAYESFRRIFSGPRWDSLRARGANVQRPLWASTSVKNPDYPDTMYVDGLIGAETVNTMPVATLAAARDHATVDETLTRDVDDAHHALAAIRDAGVDVDDIVLNQLPTEGVAAFAASFDELVATIGRKATQLAARGA